MGELFCFLGTIAMLGWMDIWGIRYLVGWMLQYKKSTFEDVFKTNINKKIKVFFVSVGICLINVFGVWAICMLSGSGNWWDWFETIYWWLPVIKGICIISLICALVPEFYLTYLKFINNIRRKI